MTKSDIKIKVYGLFKLNKKQFIIVYGLLMTLFISGTVIFFVIDVPSLTHSSNRFVNLFYKNADITFLFFSLWTIIEGQFYWARFNKEHLKIISKQNDEIREKNDILLQQKEEIEAIAESLKTANEEISGQRDTVQEQKEHIEEIHKHISDSIDYATRIQTSILPNENILKEHLADHFVYYLPKDKVSGDFFWWSHIEGHTVITAADCTGHGVPGAFMSMLGVSFLREIVNKEYITHPGVILRRLRKEIITALRQKERETGSQDGMDMALVTINHETGKLQFAGANNPLYLIRKEALKINNDKIVQVDLNGKINGHYFYEIKPDRMPIAIYLKMDKFTTHEIELQKGDQIYMFSDGFADQFGGPNERKFKYKPFKQLLFEHADKSMIEQKTLLEKRFNEWKGEIEQVDDVVVLGIEL